ncbi:ATP-binding protein [Roseomonas sp. M0104]|uniref:histidine kinase n=1 Tax=Teichococcus coralli TaxID=2545983 RepID=A0A845BG53_9PROT|nr:ATP-binding protein [Pseudoroseomonas coralli]MXP66061.1 ATP-binding protein [Pseudoroseomonas coralli]
MLLLTLTNACTAAALLFCLLACPGRRRAERRAAGLAQELAARNRQLDLFASELQSLGLGMMGQANATPAAGMDGGVEGHGRALLCLAADLRDAAALAAGPRVLKEEALQLGPVLEEALEQVRLALVPSRRQWRLAPELHEIAILADRRAIRGALVQVLTRAVRHTRNGDPIELRLVRAAETVAIVVEDEGAGLAAEDLTAIGGTGTRGLGLGLVVARQLLHAHDGELTVEAVKGIGARAWLTLPRRRLLEPAPSPG